MTTSTFAHTSPAGAAPLPIADPAQVPVAAPPAHVAPQPVTPTPSTPTGEPVFVDPTGRRRRLAGSAVAATLLGVCGLVGLTVTSVATDAGAPVEWHPTSTARITPVGR